MLKRIIQNITDDGQIKFTVESLEVSFRIMFIYSEWFEKRLVTVASVCK